MSRTPRPCRVCPLYANGWCAHRATTMPPEAPSCEFGRRKMNSEAAAECNRRKFGWRKREKKFDNDETETGNEGE